MTPAKCQCLLTQVGGEPLKIIENFCPVHGMPQVRPETEARIMADIAKDTAKEEAQRKALIAAHAAIAAAVWLTDNLEAREELRAALQQVTEALS